MQTYQMLACLPAVDEPGTVIAKKSVHRRFKLFLRCLPGWEQATVLHLSSKDSLGIVADCRDSSLVEKRFDVEIAVCVVKGPFARVSVIFLVHISVLVA
jgi:hypothetical protein